MGVDFEITVSATSVFIVFLGLKNLLTLSHRPAGSSVTVDRDRLRAYGQEIPT
jgi:hypothetical protein